MMVAKGHEKRTVFGVSFTRLVASVASMGVAVYAILYVFYNGLYGQLGVAPETVGLTYAAMLHRSIDVLVILFAFWVVAAFLLRALLFLLILTTTWKLNAAGRGWTAGPAVAAVAVLAILGLLIVPRDVRMAVDALNTGTGIARFDLCVLRVEAQPARAPAVEAIPGSGPAAAPTPVLYLGTADGQSVLYDHARRTVRYATREDIVLLPGQPLELSYWALWPSRLPHCLWADEGGLLPWVPLTGLALTAVTGFVGLVFLAILTIVAFVLIAFPFFQAWKSRHWRLGVATTANVALSLFVGVGFPAIGLIVFAVGAMSAFAFAAHLAELEWTQALKDLDDRRPQGPA